MSDFRKLTIRQKLSAVQTELIVPKKRSMKGKNGKVMYMYRNLDDIFEALKPINNNYGVLFTIDESIIDCGGILFRKSVSTICDAEVDADITAESLVRENVSNEGFQAMEQKSGGSSSYGSKLSLSKLLLLDDNDDPDDRNFTPDGEKVFVFRTPKEWGKFGGKTIKQLSAADISHLRESMLSRSEISAISEEFLKLTKV